MRYTTLRVRNFRAVDAAELRFGPGLNVLYGPNDYGKSTLAAALRAALLLPPDSTAHESFLPWHSGESPEVCLELSCGDARYRVTKVFGSGRGASAQLEQVGEGGAYVIVERGRAVERRLRELLGWGIDPPGGRGGARGLPESFLSHVLLGEQGEVSSLLRRSLAADANPEGREALRGALQALAQDPLFAKVLARAEERVELAFTPTGRRRGGKSSPFSLLRQRIEGLQEEHERLAQQQRDSREVQGRIAAAREGRLSLEARLDAAERQRAQLRQQQAARQRYEQLAERVRVARAALDEAQALQAEVAQRERELEVLAAELEGLGQRRARLEQELSALEQEQRVAHERLQQAEAASGLVGADQREALALLEQEQQRATRALELRGEVERARLAVAQARDQAAAEAGHIEKAAGALAAAEARRADSARLLRFGQLQSAERELRQLREAEQLAEVDELEARRLSDEARARRAALRPALELAPDSLERFRRLDADLAVARGRLDLGLTVRLRLPGEGHWQATIDGRQVAGRGVEAEPGAGSLCESSASELRLHGRSEIQLSLPGSIALSAEAGEASFRGELKRLEKIHAEQVEPALGAAHVASVAELAQAVEAQRRESEAVIELEARAARLVERAEHRRPPPDRAAALEATARQRRAQLQPAGAGPVEAELSARLTALGAQWESRLLESLSAHEQEASLAREERQRREAAQARCRAGTEAAERELSRLLAVFESHLAAIGAVGSAPGGLDRHARALRDRREALALEMERASRQQQQRHAAAREAVARLGVQSEERARALRERREREQSGRERAAALQATAAEQKKAARLRPTEAAAQELQGAERALEALGPEPAQCSAELARVEELISGLEGELRRLLGELDRAEGALQQVGGQVVEERCRKTFDALEMARREQVDLERDYDAYRLLSQTLREVESEEGEHLGRALAGPLATRFSELTRGRYRELDIDPTLSLTAVRASGQPRDFSTLSEGTQEQLATLLRLCVAEHLGRALVLDDHLVQTHRERAAWFHDYLRTVAHRVQILVITARPEDYLLETELPQEEPDRDLGPRLRAIDLERAIQRAHLVA